MTNEDMTLEQICDMIGENIPEDWEIRFGFARGELWIDLIDPEGEKLEVCTDDMTLPETVLHLVNHARDLDGLDPADYPGVRRMNSMGVLDLDDL